MPLIVDDRTHLEMAQHWQEAAAYIVRCERRNRDAGFHWLCVDQQDEAARFYRLARALMGLVVL